MKGLPIETPPRVRLRSCVPGMEQSERGESPRARYKRSRGLGEGQGRRREATPYPDYAAREIRMERHMIIKHSGIEPKIDPSSYIAPTAVVIGNVSIGAGAKVMFGAVINSEGSRVTIGEGTIISENAVIRATADGNKEHFVAIGESVFIGPHATILGGVLEPCCYIATGATILHGAKVSSGSVVAVGALVHANAVVPKDFFVPPYSTALSTKCSMTSRRCK